MKLFRTILGVGVAGIAASAYANTSFFVAPSFRGGPYAYFAGWETFATPVGAPGNHGYLAGSTTQATLTQLDPLASITGTGNLYNQNGVSSFELKYSNDAVNKIDTVVLQVRSVGNELNYDSFRLEFDATSLAGTRTELERTPFGGPPGTPGSGVSVTSSYTWKLQETPNSPLTIKFTAADISVSFDAAHLDIQTVPEPSTWALLGLGASALVVLQRRRR